MWIVEPVPNTVREVKSDSPHIQQRHLARSRPAKHVTCRCDNRVAESADVKLVINFRIANFFKCRERVRSGSSISEKPNKSIASILETGDCSGVAEEIIKRLLRAFGGRRLEDMR